MGLDGAIAVTSRIATDAGPSVDGLVGDREYLSGRQRSALLLHQRVAAHAEKVPEARQRLRHVGVRVFEVTAVYL